MEAGSARGQEPVDNYTRGQGSPIDETRGQGSSTDYTRGQGSLIGNTRGQGSPIDDARGQGPSTDYTRGQGSLIGNTRGQGTRIDNTRGQGSRIDYTRGQGSLIDNARGQGSRIDYTRGQGSLIDNTRGQGSRIDYTRGQGSEYDNGGESELMYTRGQGQINKFLEAESSRRHGTCDQRRRGCSSTRRSRRRRTCSSSSEEVSGESDKAHSRHKRTRYSKSSTNDILDKVLSIVRDVRSSDKHKLSFDKNVVPEFDPMTKQQTILNWITKVEECAEIYGWDERETIHYSLPKLSGIAKSWYQGLPTLLHSWAEWKKKLIESFPCREDYAELLTEMLGKRARYGESLEHYYYTKINLINRCRLTGRQAVDCILHGVDDRAVRVGAQAAQFSEPEQVLKYFKTVKVATSRENTDQYRRYKIDKTIGSTNASNKSILSKPSSSNSSIRCFNCNQQGHPSFKCDKPLIKCTKCDRLGHQTVNCYRTKANEAIGSNNDALNRNEKHVSELSVNNKPNDKYIMDIYVNNKSFECHLDLGSQCSLIRESDAKLLNNNILTDVELPMLRGIGANLIRPLGLLVAIVEVQEISETVDLYVVEDYVLRHSILLGHSFTEKPNIIITKTPDKIIFKKITYNQKVHLISRDSVEITVDGLRAVPVISKILSKGTVYVNGSIRGSEGKEYYILPGEYTITNNECVLLIHNVSKNNIKIEKDLLLTRATQIHVSLNTCELTISTTETDDSINCNSDLSTEERLALQNMLSEYSDCFSNSLKDLGFTNATEMSINLEDSVPVVYRPYRMSHSERLLVSDMVQEMLDSGIVRESSSPYASPIVLVKKKQVRRDCALIIGL